MEIGAGCVKASNKNSNVYCVQIWKIGTEHNKAALQLPHRAVTGDSRQKAADQHEAGQATGTATGGEGAGRVSGRDGWQTVSEAEATSWQWQLNAETRIRSRAGAAA